MSKAFVLACLAACNGENKVFDTSNPKTDSGVKDSGDVEPTSPCTESYIQVDNEPKHYPSIQAAIDDAHDGSTVYVCPGIHYETLITRGRKIINIIGNSYEDTIIDANQKGSVIEVFSDVNIYDITLTGGAATRISYEIDDSFGGAINSSNGCNISLTRVLIKDNYAALGGGIFFDENIHNKKIEHPLITINESFVFNNRGCGISLSKGRLESYNTDWDNSPYDDVCANGSLGGFILNIDDSKSFFCDTDNDGDICQYFD